jgi:hypothetical protein
MFPPTVATDNGTIADIATYAWTIPADRILGA